MSARRIRAVARRIVAQFRHDRRSIALLVVAPLLVLSLVGALWGASTQTVVRLVVATDRGLFATLPTAAEPLLRLIGERPELTARAATYDEAVRALRDGAADAVLTIASPAPAILVEGSDPLRTQSVIATVQRAVVRASGSSVPQPGVDYLYGGASYTLLDYLAPVLIAFFAFFFIFLLATVSFLRERTSGTLERLMATPLRRGELVLGYLIGFSFFALVQATLIIAFTVLVLKVQYRGSITSIFVVETAIVIVAVSLGLLVSAFARNELQAVQFIPVVILPQVFVSGLLVPVEQLPDVLRWLSVVLPLTYANEALRSVMVKGYALGDALVLRDLGIIALFGVLTLAGAIASIRREIA